MKQGLQQLPSPRIVTVSKQFRMDCETPVSLYLKAAMEKSRGFILESVEHGQFSGRYSFVGWEPILHFSFSPPRLEIRGAIEAEIETAQPLEVLKTLLKRIVMVDDQSIPNARGGLVGHIGYEAIRLVEEIGEYGGSEVPWIDLMLPRCVLILDHLKHTVTGLCHHVVAEGGREEQARRSAARGLEEVLAKIRGFSVANAMVPVRELPINMDLWSSNLTRTEFCRGVERGKRHILEGDVFQVVLSRVLRRRFESDPFEIYRALRQINPSPYMFYLKQGERAILGSSPESLVTLEQGRMTTKPIAGTRPRGDDLARDLLLEKELLADHKEIAEHVMLVDLGRNDLGRVARPGSVKVPQFMQIERYSHVMHIVSVVEAQLAENYHALDALMSVFPAGTLSGAPKIRAMQLINELEPETRDIYGGAIGFLDFSGNMDSCIAIRTAVVENGMVRVQAGAGIVADSVPDKEYDETTHKMMSLLSAVERAARMASSS